MRLGGDSAGKGSAVIGESWVTVQVAYVLLFCFVLF
jgi:hypothetical protein